MVMTGKVGKDKFEANFDDDGGDDDAEVGFDVDMPNEVDDGGDKYCDGNPSVVHGLGARGEENARFGGFAMVFEISGKEKFERDRGN